MTSTKSELLQTLEPSTFTRRHTPNRNAHACSPKDMYKKVHSRAVILNSTWKQPKTFIKSRTGRIYSHAMEYDRHSKKEQHTNTQDIMDEPPNIMLSDRSQRSKSTEYITPYIECLKQANSSMRLRSTSWLPFGRGSPGPIPRGEFWDTGNVLFLLLDVDGVVGWVNPSGCIHGYLSVCSGCTFMYIGYNSG